MITTLKSNYCLLIADEWQEKALQGKLESDEICLTFDDALACQYDIAYPVLKELGIKAFWFVYTSIFCGTLEKLEIYRHFRFSMFPNVELFYEAFINTVIDNQQQLGMDIDNLISEFNPKNYLTQFTFYTDSDRLFRYLRDLVLGEEKYYSIMDIMINDYGYDIEGNKHLLWINEDQILTLHKDKQIIGLHSHSHPTNLSAKTYEEQFNEYSKNKTVLEDLLNSPISTASYPCNSSNQDTDKIMEELGVKLGFDAILHDKQTNYLHFPRKDHAYLIKEMKI